MFSEKAPNFFLWLRVLLFSARFSGFLPSEVRPFFRRLTLVLMCRQHTPVGSRMHSMSLRGRSVFFDVQLRS